MNASVVTKYSNCLIINGLYCFHWLSFQLRIYLLMFNNNNVRVKSPVSSISGFLILRAISNSIFSSYHIIKTHIEI